MLFSFTYSSYKFWVSAFTHFSFSKCFKSKHFFCVLTGWIQNPVFDLRNQFLLIQRSSLQKLFHFSYSHGYEPVFLLVQKEHSFQHPCIGSLSLLQQITESYYHYTRVYKALNVLNLHIKQIVSPSILPTATFACYGPKLWNNLSITINEQIT